MTQPNKPVSQRAELKPCPWCGDTERLSMQSVGSLTGDMPDRPYRVICTHLDHDTVTGPVGFGKADATRLWNRRPAEIIASLSSEGEREERAHLETIDQRDQAEAAADMLARDIARITGEAIGEHSNLNSPWANAHEAAEEYIAASTPSQSDVIEKCARVAEERAVQLRALAANHVARGMSRTASQIDNKADLADNIAAAIRKLTSKEGRP